MGDFHKIYSSLILEDEDYKIKIDSKTETDVETLKRIESELEELESLGFQNTLNSRDLSSTHSKLKESKMEIDEAEVYNKLKSAFPDCLLIPNDKFNKILEDNNLVVRTTHFYIGSVPLSVINKVKAYKDALNKIDGDVSRNFTLSIALTKEFKYDRMTLFKRELDIILNRLHRSVVLSKEYRHESTDEIESILIKDGGYNKSSAKELSKVISRNSKYSFGWIGSKNLLIACPDSMSKPIGIRDNSIYDQNKAQDKLKRSKPFDPIIFQYTNVGVLVIDSWGKESHSEILLEHRDKLKLNDLPD